MGKYIGRRRAYVYGLIDPRSGLIRYVGKSLTPEQRLRRHILNEEGDPSGKKNRWVGSLAKQALEPGMTILAEGDWTSDELDDHERKWIALARVLVGPQLLTNIGDGGEGGWEHVNRVSTERKRYRLAPIAQAKRKAGLDWRGNPVPEGHYPAAFDCLHCHQRVEYPKLRQVHFCDTCWKAGVRRRRRRGSPEQTTLE